MTDKSYVIIFAGIGLVVAFVASEPLRHPKEQHVGTPLRAGSIMATSEEKNLTTASTQGGQLYAQGQILIDDALKSKVGTYPALFVLAKAPETRGAPIAVKRFEHPQLPLTFSLTQADSPFGDNFYDGDLVVTARLDQDGSAGPKQAGDIEATVPIKKGAAREVQIVLK